MGRIAIPAPLASIGLSLEFVLSAGDRVFFQPYGFPQPLLGGSSFGFIGSPEPGTLVLTAIGLVGLARHRRRTERDRACRGSTRT